jgi:hypothetical protein
MGIPAFSLGGIIMVKASLTSHALTRQKQRGFRATGFERIYRYGTMIGDQEIFMTNNEIQSRIHEYKLEIQMLERLRNCKIVVDGNVIITGYHTTKRERRKCRLRKR